MASLKLSCRVLNVAQTAGPDGAIVKEDLRMQVVDAADPKLATRGGIGLAIADPAKIGQVKIGTMVSVEITVT